MTTTTVDVPDNVLSTLLAGFVAGAASRTLDSAADRSSRPEFLHPGDPFGRVLAWVWQLSPDRAMIQLADYLAELRVHGPGAGDLDPPIRLEEILRGLRFALPQGFTDYDQIVERARQQVPRLYGDDV